MGYSDAYGLLGTLRGVWGFIDSLTVPVILLELILIALVYFTLSYTLMLIGRKVGQTDDWMAYVPIAADIYRLRFVDAPKWHVFFFGFTGTLLIATVEWVMLLLCRSSLSTAFLILGLILLLAYAVVSIYVTFQYLTRYYKSFGFHPMLAMVHFTPFLCIFEAGFNLYFAYNHEVVFRKQTGTTWQNDSGFRNAPAQGASPVLRKGVIYGINGIYKDATFEVADMEDVLFGRENPDCQIIFDQFNTDVSRKQCSVRYNAKDKTYIVTDYSKNGTFTSEDHRLQPSVPVALPAGTIIFLGNRENMFRLGQTKPV